MQHEKIGFLFIVTIIIYLQNNYTVSAYSIW